MMDDLEGRVEPGISRRDLVRRGAILGGAVLWATPVVQSLGPSAGAQTPRTRCGCCYCWDGDRNNPSDDSCADNGPVIVTNCHTGTGGLCEGFQNAESCSEFAGGCTCRQITDPGVSPGENGCRCA